MHFITLTTTSNAQENEIGFFIGGSNYVGDIGRNYYIYPNKPAGAVFYKYNWNPRIAFRATYSYLPISGNDTDADIKFRRDRQYNFSNTINELAVGIEYNFYEYNISSEDKSWTPYLIFELVGFNYTSVASNPSPGVINYENKTSFERSRTDF